MTSATSSERFDLSHLGRTDLYELYAELLREAPVYWSPRLAGWYISGYRYVVESFRDRRLSANRLDPVFQAMTPERRQATEPLASSLSRWTLLMDPPDHTRVRALIAKAFTPRLIHGLEPEIRDLVDQLLAPLVERGHMDVVSDFAYPLPATVIALMLGIPLEDIGLIKSWSDDIADFFGLSSFEPEKVRATQDSVVAMSDYFRDQIAEHRKEPRDDLMSRLIASREEGTMLDEEELISTLIQLVFAGHETTTNLIANAVLTLDRHPEAKAQLREDPSLIPGAVEEVLRYESPVQRLSRMAAVDFELGGQSIRKGQRIFLLTGAANRDPEVFPDPDRFDIRRQENRHLGFGWGRHFCIGAALGRLETRLSLEAMLDRCPRLRVVEEPSWHRTSALRALPSLHVEL